MEYINIIFICIALRSLMNFGPDSHACDSDSVRVEGHKVNIKGMCGTIDNTKKS
jgi:hypothetical protein